MQNEKRKKLQAAGFRIGDAEDFLELNEAERELVELRLQLSRRTRELREEGGLTQEQLARKMNSSQSRVAKIETAEAGVSLELSFRAYFAAGGRLRDLMKKTRVKGTKRQKASSELAEV